MIKIQQINQVISKENRPIKVIQYGEGNFLRAFVEYMVDTANEKGIFNGSVQIIKPIESGSLDAFNLQDCLYTVLLRGIKDGKKSVEKRIITCVAGAADAYSEYEKYAAFAKDPDLRFIVSNTTEAGIIYDENDEISFCPPKTYPGKLTKFLYERYIAFSGAKDKGLIILPVELIEKNGLKLKKCCQKLSKNWNLPQDFLNWLNSNIIFCNTLVDRIVTGYPKDEINELENELGYTDKLIVTGEPFGLWVIESENPEKVEMELPFDKAGLPVIFTNDLQPYRERKVRILNGTHTSSALAAYLFGLNTVEDIMKDKTMRIFLERAMYGELAHMVPLPVEEVKQFADSVTERFKNPFIKHNLLSIALNSVSKFKTRVLPTILETYNKTEEFPAVLTFSLAALMVFYSGCIDDGQLTAKRGDDTYEILDDASILQFFAFNHDLPALQFVNAFLSRDDFWGLDLSQISGFTDAVTKNLINIQENGMRTAIENLLK